MKSRSFLGAAVLLSLPLFAHAASRTFDIEAYNWGFRITPPQFVVNQGDSVTLRLRATSGFHGFYLDRYVTNAPSLSSPEPITITFVADKSGTFAFACTQFYCGSGHFDMHGEFEVIGPDTKPLVVTSFQPPRGGTAGGTLVAIAGTGFTKESRAFFGSAAALPVFFMNETTLYVEAPPQPPGNVAVTVQQPSGRAATSVEQYAYVVSPSIDSVVPPSGSSSGGTQVTITGSDFQQGATVWFGRAATGVTVMSSTTITATTPIGPQAIPPRSSLPVQVTVINPDQITGFRAAAFSYVLAPLSVASLSPSSGDPAGGYAVTITGTGFTTAVPMQVIFGGVSSPGVQVIDPVTLVAIAPLHSPGTVDVIVTGTGASVSAGYVFTYTGTPARKRRVAR